MHRRSAVPLLLTTLLLAACGGGGDGKAAEPENGGPVASAAPSAAASGSASASPAPSTRPVPGVATDKNAKLPEITAGKKFGEEPTIATHGAPPPDIMFKVLSEGDGPELQSGQVLVANFLGRVWDADNFEIPPFENTFDKGPVVKLIGRGQIIPAWDLKLPGVKIGSRVMLVTPPSGAFGPEGNESAGILGIDTLAFVIDLVDAFNPDRTAEGTAVTPDKALPEVTGDVNPKIAKPKGDPPSTLVDQVLIRGKGPKLRNDQTVVVHYTGVLWRNGEQFDTSWGGKGRPASPFGFHLGSDGVIAGWNEALQGKPVGSRLLLVIPPAKGYGSAGKGSIKGTDTMVFVVDILAAYDIAAP